MILLNRVILHDKTLVVKNLGDKEAETKSHKLCTSKELQTEFDDLIRNYFKRHILGLKSFIDSIPEDDIHVQYKDSNDEDLLFTEFNNLIASEPGEEISALGVFSHLFDKLYERIRQIKENEGEMSFKVLFDFT